MDALEDGLRRGVFYGRWDFDGEVMAPLKQHERFPAFSQANLDRIAEAEKTAAMKLEVTTPPGYDRSRRYPLFVALHGDVAWWSAMLDDLAEWDGGPASVAGVCRRQTRSRVWQAARPLT